MLSKILLCLTLFTVVSYCRWNDDVNNWINQQTNKKWFDNRINDDINTQVNKLIDAVQKDDQNQISKILSEPVDIPFGVVMVSGIIIFFMIPCCFCR